MPWIRLDDDYMNDEKIQNLSDGAFRLWHEGLAYCRKQETDGIIPFVVMRNFRAYTKSRERQLSTPHRDGITPLWGLIPATGYLMNQYLKWNLSKEQAEKTRKDSKARMKLHREKGRYAVTEPVTTAQHPQGCDGEVLGRDGLSSGSLSLKEGSGEKTTRPEPTARSNRPIFRGQRLTVFEWMLDDCMGTLGPHLNDFGLDEWFWELDARAVRDGLVIPKRDGGAWLQAQLVAEAQRRGLPLQMAHTESKPVRDFDAGRRAYEAERDRQVAQVRALLNAEKGA